MCISCVLTLAVKLSLNSVLYNGLVQLVPVLYAVNLFQIKINDLDAVSSRKPPIFQIPFNLAVCTGRQSSVDNSGQQSELVMARDGYICLH